MKGYDVIVLGVGGIGSAALYHLARPGVRVLGIDRFNPPHDRGSSHGQTRVIRQAYFEHPDYVPLLREAYREWHDLEAIVGRRLFHQIGLVEIGPADGAVVPGVLRAAVEHRLSVEQLTAAQIVSRWPGLRADSGLIGVFEPTAGYLLVEDCVRAHIECAQAAGAELLINTEVRNLSSNDRVVIVRTSEGIGFEANCVVITGGAWSAELLTQIGIPLTVRRKSLFWFATSDRAYKADSGMPVYLFELADGVFYGFPKLDHRGVKFAEHSGGRIVEDPRIVDRAIDVEEQRRLVNVLARHLPGVEPKVTDHTTCLYTMSPDEHFIVDRHPLLPRTVFAAGLSGHGFKFAPVLGKALAEMALTGGTTLPIDFLSLARFG
jgi:monomeric sarcosine oxidase